MEATAKEIKQNRDGMLARLEREVQEGIVKGYYCPDCHSPNKGNRWFYHKDEATELTRCDNMKWHAKPKARKAQMTRSDWYMVLTLLLLANAALFDEAKSWGMCLMGAAILIVVLVDGFGIKL